MGHFLRRTLGLGVPVIAGMVLGGCNPAWEDVRAAARAQVAEMQPQIDARRALLEELVVRTLAATREDLPALDLGGRPKLHFGSGGQGSNALVATIEDIRWKDPFKDQPPGTIKNTTLADLRHIEAGYPSEYADRTSIEKTRTAVRKVIARFTGPRYLVIVRTHERRLPKIIKLNPQAMGRNPKSDKAGTFAPGLFLGDLFVYDLSDKTLLGAAEVRATSSHKIKTAGYDVMADDLWIVTRKAINAALEPICDSPCAW
jgi:hypothetical protein